MRAFVLADEITWDALDALLAHETATIEMTFSGIVVQLHPERLPAEQRKRQLAAFVLAASRACAQNASSCSYIVNERGESTFFIGATAMPCELIGVTDAASQLRISDAGVYVDISLRSLRRIVL